jgi:hypothetical protein
MVRQEHSRNVHSQGSRHRPIRFLRLVMKLLFFECEGPVEVVLYLRELYAKLLHAASKS